MNKTYRTKNGKYRPTKIYDIWQQMKGRCYNESNKAYEHYGKRGIRVCERWLNFENFYHDMGDKPAGLSLDRIDNDGNYEPLNCRWATRMEQQRNRRYVWTVIVSGKKRPLIEFLEEQGMRVHLDAVKNRITTGMSIEESIEKPFGRWEVTR